MATTISFYNCFSQDLLYGVHQFQSHAFFVALSVSINPNHTGFADLSEISSGFGYPLGGISIGGVSIMPGVSGTSRVLVSSDPSLVATGGDIGPFRYLSMYNNTANGKPLICYWNYQTAYTIVDGVTFPIDFNQDGGIILIKPAVTS